jgi:hypothetical protein
MSEWRSSSAPCGTMHTNKILIIFKKSLPVQAQKKRWRAEEEARHDAAGSSSASPGGKKNAFYKLFTTF